MGTNRRFGAPSERAAARIQREADYTPRVPKVRHVWVRSSARGDADGYPGLVIAWRRDRGSLETSGWTAQVAYVVGDDDLSVGWVPAEHLLPVDTV